MLPVPIYRRFGELICTTFKGQADLDFLTPNYGTDRSSWNVCK